MGFVLGHWAMLDPLRHHEDLTRAKLNRPVSQLNGDVSSENQKEIVRVVMFVPNEFTFDLHHHEVVTVEATDNARLPVFRER
jgi:hypothetical protein